MKMPGFDATSSLSTGQVFRTGANGISSTTSAWVTRQANGGLDGDGVFASLIVKQRDPCEECRWTCFPIGQGQYCDFVCRSLPC